MMLIGRLRPHRETKHRNKAGAPRAHEDYRATLGPASSFTSRDGRSLLEQLPTELLQQIFIISANLNLPFCSRQLLAALSSGHLKYELALQIFVFQAHRLSRNYRSSVLSRRFFDWSFVLRYARFAHARIPADLADSEDGDDDSKSASSSSSASEDDDDSLSSDEAEAEDQANDGASLAAVSTGSTATMKTCRSAAPSFDGLTEESLPSLADECMKLSWSLAFDRESIDVQTGYETLNQFKNLPASRGLIDELYLPPKLLHGPWNDDRLQLLRYLVSLGCNVASEPSAEAVLKRAMLDAIEANDEEVAWHLIDRVAPADLDAEFTLEMLRAAVKQNAISTVYMTLAKYGQTVDRLDAQVWNLVDAHAKWSKREKKMIQKWLRKASAAERLPDKKYLPHLRAIEREQKGAGKRLEKESS